MSNRVFKFWPDNRFNTRIELLEQINQRGISALGDPKSGLMKACFPNGYDPENHPEDNLDTVRAEGVRRGVLTP